MMRIEKLVRKRDLNNRYEISYNFLNCPHCCLLTHVCMPLDDDFWCNFLYFEHFFYCFARGEFARALQRWWLIILGIMGSIIEPLARRSSDEVINSFWLVCARCGLCGARWWWKRLSEHDFWILISRATFIEFLLFSILSVCRVFCYLNFFFISIAVFFQLLELLRREKLSHDRQLLYVKRNKHLNRRL